MILAAPHRFSDTNRFQDGILFLGNEQVLFLGKLNVATPKGTSQQPDTKTADKENSPLHLYEQTITQQVRYSSRLEHMKLHY